MAELTKEKIIDAAVELFVQHGIRGVSIDEICHELGISKKTFYVFYMKKEDLVKDVFTLKFAEKNAKMSKYMGHRETIDILKDFSNINDDYRMFKSNYYRLIYDLKKYYPKISDQLSIDSFNSVKEILDTFIKRGIKEGVFRDCLDKEAYILSITFMFKGLNTFGFDSYLLPKDNPSIKDLYKAFMDMLTHTLLSPKGWEVYEKDKKKEN